MAASGGSDRALAGVLGRRQKVAHGHHLKSAGKGTSYRSLAFLGLGCAREQKTITVADLRRSNTRPKKLNYASKRRSNRLRTIGLRLLSKPNGWSTTAVRNTAVPRQKNLNRPLRNCGRRRRLKHPHWPRHWAKYLSETRIQSP